MRLPRRPGRLGSVRLFWRTLIVCLVTLPVGAYVAGTLAASQAEAPAQRTPIVVSDQEASGTAAPSSDPTRPPAPSTSTDDVVGERDGDSGRDEDDDDDDDVDSVNPTPDDIDDDDDDDRGRGGGDDDRDDGDGDGAGPGSGGDDD